MPSSPAHPCFAAVYDLLQASALAPLRARLVEGCRGDVLDLGTGTGANLAVLRNATTDIRITAVDPDPHMLRRARRRAAVLGLAVDFQQAPAESLPFPDGSFDFVVAGLVLCTVAEPQHAVAEVHRVLRPRGEFRFLEHVRAEGRAGWWQDRLRPLWAWLGGGCQLNRRTGETLRAGPFAEVTWETIPLPPPVHLAVLGRARRE